MPLVIRGSHGKPKSLQIYTYSHLPQDPTNEFRKARAFLDMIRLEIAVKEEIAQIQDWMTAEELVQLAVCHI